MIMNKTRLTLEQRVQRIEDIEAIRRLKSTYHLYINDTAFEKVATLYTDDAYVNYSYLMPGGKPWVGKSEISAAFASMKTNEGQSQIKQFLHSHIVDVKDENYANGTAILLACYGVGVESYVVSGKYIEEYARVEEEWLFKSMRLALYFTVPLKDGWAGLKRHYLVNSGAVIPDYVDLVPNAPI
jgi:ketosteroid isomerase-like protein